MEVLRLKEVLKEKKMSGKGLAEAVNVTPVSISNIAQGNSFPKPELLIEIANTLDVDVSELFNKTKDVTHLNGFIEYKGNIHKIKSLSDLKALAGIIENN